MPTDSDWNARKGVLYDLWMVKKRPLRGRSSSVMEQMKEQGFDATYYSDPYLSSYALTDYL